MKSQQVKNAIFVYNPLSGEGDIADYLDMIVSIYQKNGYCVTLLRIEKELSFNPLPDLVRALNPAHILVAGGDGTVNQLVNFMFHHAISTPLAVMPTGTANDFAHTLGMPRNPLKALRSVINGQNIKVDLGRVGERYFVNVLSCGLMADLSQRTPTALKNTFGKVAYYFSSIGELPNFKKMAISVKSKELNYEGNCLLVMIFNGRSAGTLRMVPAASITDGVLDVLIIKGENIVNTIGTLFHFLLQRKGSYPDDVVYFQTNRLTIELHGDNVATDVDGEQGGGFPLNVECISEALNVIIPSPRPTKKSLR